MTSQNWVNINSGNGLVLSGDSKALTEPILSKLR